MVNPSDSKSYSCNECQAGKLTAKRVTYYTWLGNQMVTVPDFPAWVCDVCGRLEYDHQAVSWLHIFLNHEAGKPAAIRKPKSKIPQNTRTHIRDSN